METIVVFLAILVLVPFSLQASPAKVKYESHKNRPSQVSVQSILQAPPDAIWKQVVRFNDYNQFMPRVVESFFISEEGVQALKEATTKNANKLSSMAKKYKMAVPRKPGEQWGGLVFMVLNTPFPVENRWYVLRTNQDETRSAQHSYKRCWDLVTGNIESAKGCWSFEPYGDGQETFSFYQDQADPGGKVPEWVTRLGATQTLPQMFHRVESLAKSEE